MCACGWVFCNVQYCFMLLLPPTLTLRVISTYQVKGPSGDQIIDVEDKTSDKFEFVVHKKGFHHLCFTNTLSRILDAVSQ